MDTNNSRFSDKDLVKIRKEDLDSSLSSNEARRENRRYRKRLARQTRRRENDDFNRKIKEGRFTDASDFLDEEDY